MATTSLQRTVRLGGRLRLGRGLRARSRLRGPNLMKPKSWNLGLESQKIRASKSRTSCTRQRNAGRPALRRDLAPALALSPLPDLTLHLSLSLVREPLAKPPSEDCRPPRPRSHKKVMSRCGTRHLPAAIPDSEFGDPGLGPLCMRDTLRNATFFGFFESTGDQVFDASY